MPIHRKPQPRVPRRKAPTGIIRHWLVHRHKNFPLSVRERAGHCARRTLGEREHPDQARFYVRFASLELHDCGSVSAFFVLNHGSYLTPWRRVVINAWWPCRFCPCVSLCGGVVLAAADKNSGHVQKCAAITQTMDD